MLEWATDYFKKHEIPDPRLSIEWLLADVLDIKRLDLYLKFDRPLSPDELDRLRPLVKRRAAHEPLQYILGFTNFMNVRLNVTSDVLIPRIETEQLVEIILDRHGEDSELRVLDIGTGSGCIPIALKKERPAWQITGMDISGEALEVARENAGANEVEIEWLRHDLFELSDIDLGRPFDLVVSNPPYVLPGDRQLLEKQVIEYEPETALFTENLQQMYGSIIRGSIPHLSSGGQLYLEIHEAYADEIRSLFDEVPLQPELLTDYQGKERFMIAQLTSQ